tara:strand:+ start:675 stop:899 length:225 start_codon:yes stop_codon:yes gene_type:complete
MKLIQEANNFPAWEIQRNNEVIGCLTNFRGEGFACTIKADFTNNVERTIYEPTIKSLEEMKAVIANFILNLKYN